MNILDRWVISELSETGLFGDGNEEISSFRSLLEMEMPKRQHVHKGPHYRMVERLLELDFPPSLVAIGPKKWERLGNVLIIQLDERLRAYEESMARDLMDVL